MTAHVIGLTGGIASGKTAVATLLRQRGAIVVDADQLARQVVAPGQPALGELVARFGNAIVGADGALDRQRMAAIAFADPAARADLNRITHPRIAAASAQAIADAAKAGATVVFYEAALLVENGAHRGLAGLIVVAASPQIQEARLIARDSITPAPPGCAALPSRECGGGSITPAPPPFGDFQGSPGCAALPSRECGGGSLSVEDARARIAAQAPLADKLAAATWVIHNDGDPAELGPQVDAVVADIERKFGPIRPLSG